MAIGKELFDILYFLWNKIKGKNVSSLSVNAIINKKDNNLNYPNVNKFIYSFCSLNKDKSNKKRKFNKSYILKFIREFKIFFQLSNILKIYIFKVL